MAITPLATVDDDGSGTTGSVYNAARQLAFEANINAAIAASGGSGTVTHTPGALTASALVVGNGAADVTVLGSLGTTATVLHGNAAGLPTFAAIAQSEVTGLVAALALLAPLASPAQTGTPTVPTAAPGTNTTQTASTAFVAAALAALLATSREANPVSVASSATPTPDAAQKLYSLTAQAAAAAFVNPTGAWTNGWTLTIRIKDNGTARALTWGTNYVAGGVALPSTTVLSKILTIGFIYNSDNALNKFQCVAVSQEA